MLATNRALPTSVAARAAARSLSGPSANSRLLSSSARVPRESAAGASQAAPGERRS